MIRLLVFFCFVFVKTGVAEEMMAGVGKVDITRPGHDAGDNPPFVKALALSIGDRHAVIVTVDAVAIGEIGSIKNSFLPDVREAVKKSLGIDPKSLVVNASHCHAVVATDVEARTIRAIETAWKNRVPVTVGVGVGKQNRIQENRRLRLKNGKETDVRHAYALPADDAVAAMGPIDPDIGIVRLDRVDSGEPLALVYHFAMHPIQGVPGGGNTADVTGYASKVIEANFGDGSATAFFLQGCGGDINPVHYKNPSVPRDSEPLGNALGLSVLKTANGIETKPGAALKIANETIELPRADLAERIAEMETEIETLVKSLKGTTLNFDQFLPLFVKYHLSGDYPSESASRYLQDEMLELEDWKKLDENNRAAMDAYLKNVRTMEEITRKQINQSLLQRHQVRNEKAGPTVAAEVVALRIGDFRLVTFPAEVTVQVGLNVKQASSHEATFVSGYTNGYLYYAPTTEQLKNRGGAQEDSDCLFAPEWQAIFEKKAAAMLGGLAE